MSVSLPASATAFWRGGSFLPQISRAWMLTSSEAILEAASWTFVRFCFARRGAITARPRAISIFAPRPLRLVEECMACAAIMRRKWPCPGWTGEGVKVAPSVPAFTRVDRPSAIRLRGWFHPVRARAWEHRVPGIDGATKDLASVFRTLL